MLFGGGGGGGGWWQQEAFDGELGAGNHDFTPSSLQNHWSRGGKYGGMWWMEMELGWIAKSMDGRYG